MVRCRTCRLVFSREILPDEKLLQLYRESHVTFSPYVPVLRRDYWRSRAIGAVRFNHPEARSAIEIGCKQWVLSRGT